MLKKEKHKAEDYPYLFRTSKSNIIFQILVSLGLFSFGIYLFLIKVYYGGIISLLMSFFLIYDFKDVIINKPVIKINHKGIWTIKTNFILWDNIEKIIFYSNDLESYDNNKSIVILFKDKKQPNITINTTRIEKRSSLIDLINHFLEQETFEKQKIRNSNWNQFV